MTAPEPSGAVAPRQAPDTPDTARCCAILVPAAGAARRMRGRDKLQEPVFGRPLLAHVAQQALGTGQPVIVTLPALDHPRAHALAGCAVQPVAVPDAAEGMAASLRRGVAALPDQAEAVMILPADMPDLENCDLSHLINAFHDDPNAIHQATSADGTPGHPVIFPRDCFAALRQISGDQGARAVLKDNAHRLRRHALQGSRAQVDLDTPEAWAQWRADHPEA